MVDTKKPNAEIAIEWLKQFDNLQRFEITIGIDSGIDVSLYAKPEFNWQQMEEIRWGLKAGVDVSLYLDPNIPWQEMRNKRIELEREKEGDLEW